MTGGFKGWRVVVAGWLIVFLNLALVYYAASVIAANMTIALNMDRSTLGLGFAVLTLMQGVSAPFVAMVMKSYGARAMIAVGSLILASGAFLLATFAVDAWHYVLLFGVVVGVGTAFSTFVPVQACISVWFVKKRALMLSIVMAATGVGGFIAAPVVAQVIEVADGNWRIGWVLIGVAAVVSAVIARTMLINHPADIGQAPDGIGVGSDTHSRPLANEGGQGSSRIYRTERTWTGRDALRTRAMWMIVLGVLAFSLPFNVAIAHLVPHFGEAGFASTIAASALGTMAFFSVIGKLLGGFFCDRFEPKHVFLVAATTAAISVLIAAQATSVFQLYLIGILLGCGYGAATICWPAIIANYYGPESFASVMGIQMPITTLIGSAAPYLIGLAYDLQGSYVFGFYSAAAIALSLAAGLLLASPPAHPAERHATSEVQA